MSVHVSLLFSVRWLANLRREVKETIKLIHWRLIDVKKRKLMFFFSCNLFVLVPHCPVVKLDSVRCFVSFSTPPFVHSLSLSLFLMFLIHKSFSKSIMMINNSHLLSFSSLSLDCFLLCLSVAESSNGGRNCSRAGGRK